MVRDKNGRFAKGNGGGPGRKARPVEEKYLEMIRSVVTPAEWRIVIEKALSQAQKGDTAARKFLADYIIGPPIERKEISGAGAGPIVFEVIYDNGK